jgi:hypothetical protein
MSTKELVSRKNEFFKDVITDEKNIFRGKGSKIIGRVEYEKDDDILLKIGVEKNKEINKSDFKKETIKDYPNINVYINNRNDKQFLIIQNNLDAFSDSITAKNILKNTWSKKLEKYQLSLYIEQTFDKNQFWDTIKQYEGRGITSLKFEFIKPNISNISGAIKSSLTAISNELNGHSIDLNIAAPRDSTLENIKEGDPIVESLLDYNKEGGGKSPLIKVKGIRSNIKTINSERTINIQEFNGTTEELIKILNGYL